MSQVPQLEQNNSIEDHKKSMSHVPRLEPINNKQQIPHVLKIPIPKFPKVPTVPDTNDSTLQQSDNDKTDASNPLSLPDLSKYGGPPKKKRKLNLQTIIVIMTIQIIIDSK